MIIIIMPESQEGEKKKQSTPLNIMCSQLGTVFFKQAVKRSIQNNNSNEIIEQLLSELKARKTTNYKTFKKHVEQQLKNSPSLSIQQFVSSFINIGKLMNRIGNKKHQTFALFEGYKIYFTNTRKLNQNTQYFIQEMLKSFMEISHELAEEVGKYLYQLWQSIQNQTEYNASEHALSIVKKYAEQGLKGHEGKQCLALVYYFNLFNRFDDEIIVSWIINEDVRQIIYGFSDKKKEVRKPLIRAYIRNKLPEGLKDIKTMIAILRLNAEEFPQFLQAVNRKKLNFFYTHFSMFFLDLKFTNRPDLIAMLAQMYIDLNKRSEAIHLINKYQLEQLYHYRGEEKSYQSNRLLELDSFLPTQCIVKNDKPEEYITLKQLGYEIRDVSVIDKMEDVDRAIEVIDGRCKVGIDCEFISSRTGYEEKKVALTQLATKSQVFLFDFITLGRYQAFREKLVKFFTNYEGQIIGHSTIDDYQVIMNSLTSQTFSRKANIVDIRSLYLKKYPHTTKSSMQHMVKHFYNVKLSKYEQCSGWEVRPLRKTQIHYAAVDAILPLQLCAKILL